MQQYTFEVTQGDEQRIDRFLAERMPEHSRAAIQRLCEGGSILCDGKPAAKNLKLRPGMQLVVNLPDPVALEAEAQEIALDIAYEDSFLLVINKPKGMVVHPGAGNPDGTLVNALLHHCEGQLSGIGGVMRPGIVHRIDKDTSGLLLVAKNDIAHRSLAAQIKEHSCERVYEAVVYGNPKADSGTVDSPIGRHPVHRKRMQCFTQAEGVRVRQAVTHYEVVARYRGFCHLRLTLETGRTHQIRVHMASLGHPVAGDTLYGPKAAITALHGQCLHAGRIAFDHPSTGERMSFNSELPQYFTKFLATLTPH